MYNNADLKKIQEFFNFSPLLAMRTKTQIFKKRLLPLEQKSITFFATALKNTNLRAL